MPSGSGFEIGTEPRLPSIPHSDFAMRQSHIAIIGAPLDLGQGRRGVDMGPSAVRVANLNARVGSLGYTVEDLGNVPVNQAEASPEGHPRAKYLPQIAATCERLATLVSQTLARDCFPL